MPERRKLIDEINQILGTRLKFGRVALGELKELRNAVRTRLEGAPILQNVKGLLNTPLTEIMRKRLANKKLEELTLKDLVGAIQGGTGDRGPLGFGLLPRLLGPRKSK